MNKSHLFCLLLVVAINLASAYAYYDDPTAHTYLKMSYAAYCDSSSVESWTCSWCQEASSTFKVTSLVQNAELDVFGYVGIDSSNGKIMVVYRGSDNLENWIENLNFSQTTEAFIPGGLVHKGFYDDYSALQQQTLNAVNQLLSQNPGALVVATGHSLGGALATLFVADYSRTYSNLEMWTFGSPRVGNQVFSDWVSQSSSLQQSWRVVNQRDVVPHLPTEDMNFHHVATEVWYTDDSTFTVCDDSGEDPSCSDSIIIPDSVYDHLHYFGLAEGC